MQAKQEISAGERKDKMRSWRSSGISQKGSANVAIFPRRNFCRENYQRLRFGKITREEGVKIHLRVNQSHIRICSISYISYYLQKHPPNFIYLRNCPLSDYGLTKF